MDDITFTPMMKGYILMMKKQSVPSQVVHRRRVVRRAVLCIHTDDEESDYAEPGSGGSHL